MADVGDDVLGLAEDEADGARRELGRGAKAGRLRQQEAPELGAAGGERGRADAEDVADARRQAERRRRAAGQRRERVLRLLLLLLLLRRGQRRRRRRRDHDGEGEGRRVEPPPRRHDGTRRWLRTMARERGVRGCIPVRDEVDRQEATAAAVYTVDGCEEMGGKACVAHQVDGPVYLTRFGHASYGTLDWFLHAASSSRGFIGEQTEEYSMPLSASMNLVVSLLTPIHLLCSGW